jgi:hypothetical protein
MQKIMLIVAAILFSSVIFAALPVSEFRQSSGQLNAIGKAWNAARTVAPLDKNDITMGYGGADISRKPTIAQHIAIS